MVGAEDECQEWQLRIEKFLSFCLIVSFFFLPVKLKLKCD
jgi:hypothetical protein